MSPRRLEILPLAAAEVQKAYRWYRRRSQSVADRFLREVDDAMARLPRCPEQWPEYLHETRAYLMRRFPYLIVYRFTNAAVTIYAVAHAKKRPGYWRRRKNP